MGSSALDAPRPASPNDQNHSAEVNVVSLRAQQDKPAGLGFPFILIFKDAVASGTKTVEIDDEHVLVFINSAALA